MKGLMSRKNWGRAAAVAVALGLGAAAFASPANAYWHGHGCCWGGPHVGIGIDLFPPPVVFAPPPPVVYAPPPVVVAPPPAPVVVQQSQPTCTNGQWRQANGSIVNGVACLQPNGTWQLTN